MQEYSAVLTNEAIYDIVDIYIRIKIQFSSEIAKAFRDNIIKQIKLIESVPKFFSRVFIFYREYMIHFKVFSPSLIFYIIEEETKEVHVLRVLREEQDWMRILRETDSYSYPDEGFDIFEEL